ncbi:MAG: FAD-binding protein [Oscillospiraceae bacterium]|nr:FAD-binding protein [Oscillospiraceae bacterium]
MKERKLDGAEVIKLHTAVVGSGAAGFHAALRLHKYGVQNIALLTEGVNMGTSRNTGSDKQTYYKMNLCGTHADSPGAMAQDLFAGRCVDGDIAYAEAALSVPCFLNLAELGVPFPVNRLGEYVGYQTDHDTRARATSAGPLTSKLMTECLEKAVREAGICIYDRYMVVEILKDGERAVGLLALKLGTADFAVFQCENIVWATGGPAGIYADSVYPRGHCGASGVAFSAGVRGRNLTEWQYGLASVAPRWNVSGTYMQVLPRFVSVDEDGTQREFLLEYYPDLGSALSMVFKKGYEWPFDSRKAQSGSSVVDLLVYRERVLRGRRVYLDFRKNPADLAELPYDELTDEARTYLQNTDACFGTPIERLVHMNAPAYDLYLSKGVDLKTEMLEIALCAQHNNGGLDIDCWWQTNVAHLFAAGEVAGSHGVYRPGGSALNAGQVGSMRAAQYIAFHTPEDAPVSDEAFRQTAKAALEEHRTLCKKLLSGGENAGKYYKEATRRMSALAGAIRSADAMEEASEQTAKLFAAFADTVRVPSAAGLQLAYRLRDALMAQMMYLAAMRDYAQKVKKSRGSALYTAPDGTSAENLEEVFRFILDDDSHGDVIQLLDWNEGRPAAAWRPTRPLLEGGGVFETVWRSYRETKNVD